MVLFNTLLHPMAAVLLCLFILFHEFFRPVTSELKGMRTGFHLSLFVLCLLAFAPSVIDPSMLTHQHLAESALLGALLGSGLLIIGHSWFASENKIIAEKKRRIAYKVPLLLALLLLTVSNHFGRVYSFYAFWILCLAFLPLAYNHDKDKTYFYQYAVFAFALSASFLVTLNANLDFYWMRIPQSFFLLVGFIFLQSGVINVSKITK